MRIRQDGSVQSSATPTEQNTRGREDFGLYRAMVTDVIYVDDPQNISANSSTPRVLYDCVVLGGFATGQQISNCRLSSTLGGNYNYYERTLRASSKDVSKTRLSDCDGDIVFVQFLQGNPSYPIIVSLDQGINVGSATGAKKADGALERSQFNGISTLIDDLGNLTWIRHGGKFDSTLNTFVPAKVDDVKATVGPQNVTLTFQSGMTLVIDGAGDSVNITTKGGAKIQLDGKSGAITLKDNGTGELKIANSKVALGASSAELLDQISQQLTKLNTVFSAVAAHTHIGNLGYPTAPPDTAGAWTTAASDMSSIKAKIDGIKGSL
jgi:hypothetical protein